VASIVGKVVRGAVAGAVGTAAMDLVWYRRYRAGGGEDGFRDWEFATGTTSYEQAGAPAKVAEKAASAVGADLPDDTAATATNVVHWLTGLGYGVARALLGPGGVAVGGAATGVGAFLNSYATLGAMGIYDPIWEYDRETLTKDLTAHLTFGLATAAAYRLLSGPDDA